ncbi:MAG TPA: urease accessory UreF family protein [Burkholderiaceae bacterium]
MAGAALLRLLQLSSPSLPVGAYSYSQGLETAIGDGTVHDAQTARAWIEDNLREVAAPFDAPLQWRLLRAFAARDAEAVQWWSERWLAARDTAELRAETVQMGYSLTQLLKQLHDDSGLLDLLQVQREPALPAAYACAAAAFGVPPDAALLGMLYAQTENQVLVCVKSVPLGQVAGQKLLLALGPAIERAAQTARALEDDDLSNWTPMLSLLSMRHEALHGRLYRS